MEAAVFYTAAKLKHVYSWDRIVLSLTSWFAHWLVH